jgi:uracil-DNA glycosylase
MKKLNNFNDAESLADINKVISNCTKCSLYKLKTKDVPGSGSAKAEIVFIGEAPGRAEDLEGEPFIGAAGKFLDEMIKHIGLDRKDVFITNILKHRPPANRDPLPEEIKVCCAHLFRQLEIIKPKLIVFLGRHALNQFFPDLKISEVHGKSFKKDWPTGTRDTEIKKQQFLALYHPAAALYNGSKRATLIKDFEEIPKLLKKIK